MPISEESYKDLKEYWDFQRKVEYNKEMVQHQIESIPGRMFDSEMGKYSDDQIFELMWSRIEQEDYDDPPTSWIPKNDNYRLWNEPPRYMNNELPKPKGRPVVLRAKTSDKSN